MIGQDEVMRTRLNILPETELKKKKKKTTQNIWNSFQDTVHQVINGSPWSMINEGTPLSAPASHTEFPGCSTERDKSNRLPELNRQSRYPEQPREPEYAEQSTTAERNTQRENARDLHRVPLKCLRGRRRKIIKICGGGSVRERQMDRHREKAEKTTGKNQ